MRAARPLLLLALSATVCVSDGLAAAEPQLRVTLEPRVVGLDELATLTLEVRQNGFGWVNLEPEFRLENFEAAGGPSSSQSQRWVNGETSSSTQLAWRLRPLAVGRAAVRGLRVTLGGEVRTLPDQEVEVVAAAPPGRQAPAPQATDPLAALFGEDSPFGFSAPLPRGAARPKLRLHSQLEPRRVYPGQQVTWRLLLDTQTDVSSFNPRELPDFRGFWVQDLPQPQQPQPQWVELDGERFGRVTMLRRALFPLRPGHYHLRATAADLVVRIASASWFGPLGQNQQVTLTTEPVDLEVLPLPPTAPGFSGIVGAVALTSALDRSRIEVGQAATFTLEARGEGNLQGLAPPPLELPPGLRAFSPRPETSSQIEGDRWITTARWSYVLTAERPGDYALPPESLTWFDPATATYHTATTDTRRLAVTAAALRTATAPPAGTPAKAQPTAARPGLAFTPASAAAASGLLTLAGLASLIAVRARRSRPARAVRVRLIDGITKARSEPSPRLAAATLEACWRDFARDRWGVGGGLPLVRWREPLARAGVPSTLVRELVALLDEIHYLRYAPELSDVESLRDEACERSRRLLRELG